MIREGPRWGSLIVNADGIRQPSLLARLAAVALAGFFAVGCDQADDGQCRPDDGCDGVDAIVAAEAAPVQVEPILAVPVEPSVAPILATVAEEEEVEIDDLRVPWSHEAVVSEDVAHWCPAEQDPNVTYIARDPEVCAEVIVSCLDGWANVPESCGCGCMYTGSTPYLDFDYAPAE